MRIVLTFTGADQPGIVHELAQVVKTVGGNWQDSRLARLAGRFAGILDVVIPDSAREALEEGLVPIQRAGVRILIDEGSSAVPEAHREIRLECTAMDRPGIVHALTQVMLARQVNILEMDTQAIETPLSGGYLFRASAMLAVPEDADTSALLADIEAIASDLLVELHEDHE